MNKKLKYFFWIILLFPFAFITSCNQDNNVIESALPIESNKDKAKNDLKVILNNLDLIKVNDLLRNYHKNYESFYQNLKKEYEDHPILEDKNINKINGDIESSIENINWENKKITFKIKTEFTRLGVKYKILHEAYQAPFEIIKQDNDNYIIAIKVTTTHINSRLNNNNDSTNMQSRDNYISVRDIFDTWDDQLDNINKDQNDHIVKNIKVLYTNNANGNINFSNLKTTEAIGDSNLGSIIKQAKPDLLISSGEFIKDIQPHDFDHAKSIMNTASLIGYDLMTVGSKDFTWGYRTLVGRAKSTPLYASNIFYNKITDIKKYNPIKGKLEKTYNILAKSNELILPGIKNKLIKGNLHVGVIALTNPVVKDKINPSNVQDIDFKNFTQTTQDEINNLKKAGTKLIIIVVHNENQSIKDTKKILSELKGVNLIVDGYSNNILTSNKLINKKTKNSASIDHNIGLITFDFDKNSQKIINIENKNISY